MPSNRTLVKATAGKSCIGLKTVSRERGSSRRFLMIREHFAKLSNEETVIVSDIHSFAALRRSEATGLLTIDFTWLSGSCNGEVSGWEESVVLPYDALMAFVRDSTREDGPKEWKHLSVCSSSRPKLVFHDQEGLRKCVANRIVRGKLARALRDNFCYPGAVQIEFYPDFEPYSFIFHEERGGCAGITGGLTLHRRENDLKKAYYSIHT